MEDTALHQVLLSFRDPSLWSGSFYELSIETAPETVTPRDLLKLLEAIWHDPLVLGVVEDFRELGKSWKQVRAVPPPRHYLYGSLRVGSGTYLGCGTIWSPPNCLFIIPLGMLERTFTVNYPLDDATTNPWMAQIDEVLAHLGMRVFGEVPFELGAVGEEVAGVVDLATLTKTRLAQQQNLLVPEALFERMGLKPHGEASAAGLWWTGGVES